MVSDPDVVTVYDGEALDEDAHVVLALSGGVVPVSDGESDTWHVLEAFMWREERGELGDEEREVWQRIADRFFRHPYGSYLRS